MAINILIGRVWISRAAHAVLRLEPLFLAITVYAFWFPSPQRDEWVGLMGLALVALVARLIVSRRLWTPTLYDELLVALLGLIVISISIAPYATRGIIMIYRPLLGAWLVLYCVEHARRHGTLNGLWRVTLGGALLLGALSLFAVDWSGKSGFLRQITDLLPNWRAFYVWEGGFNPNEIAGALAWLLPVCAVFAFHKRHWAAGVAGTLMLVGLGLGQSLAGIVGVAIGVGVALLPRRWWFGGALLVFAGLIAAQIAILAAPYETVRVLRELSPRENARSLDHRAELWQSALDIVSDHPLTGAGIAMYRHPQVRADYPTPGFPPRDAVHPHNELLQFLADFGLPGGVLWLGFALMTAYLLTVIMRGGEAGQISGRALAGALLAHAVYGLADAIPIWDRFAFVGWWLLGLLAAQAYLMTAQPVPGSPSDSRVSTGADSAR